MDANDAPLLFTIEIYGANFVTPGRYFLILKITGSKVNPRALKLYVGDSKVPLNDNEFTTDACLEDGDPETLATFTDSVISFWVPQESADGDIKLLVEAFQLPENPLHEGDKYGEAVFDVFPRKGTLFSAVRQKTPSSRDSQELYQFETNMTLSQVVTNEGFSANAGVIRAAVSLKQDQPKQEEPEEDPAREPEYVKPKLLPVPGDPGPGPSSASDTSTAIRTIQETALGSNINSIPVQHLCGSYLAREGYCEVVVLAHGALGLPMKSDGRPPQPYIAGKSGKAEAQNQMGQSVTHASIQPTQSPSWEEILLVEFREENSKDEVLILLLADHPSKELLTEYTVPLAHLKPFHQYHLELVQPNPELSGDIRLYITLMMKMDKLPLPSAGFKVFGLEVLLRSLEAPVSSQMGPLVATGRIVADWKEYKESMLSSQPRPAGVTVTTIDFPSPHPTSFAVAGATPAQGAPQVTTAGTPQEQPQWNQSLFFIGDESSLFTVTSALVIEYYPASLAMSRDSWQLSSPVGYSYQTLDQLLLSSLKWDSSKLGLRLDNLPIEGSNLRTAIGTSPSVGMVLRLVTSQRPDQQLTAAHLSSLPVFRTAPAQQQTQQGQSFYNTHQPADTAEQTPYGLPPMNAVKTILPHFHSLYNAGPKTEPVKEYVPLANLSSPNVSTPPERGSIEAAGSIQIPPEVRGKMDIRDLAVMDYQMKEVDRYRTAMRKMATDLLHVREDCKRLEQANSRLRRELGQHDEISRLMVSSKDLDNVTHTELVQKFVLLKKKLADESSKKQDLQTRLQHLQNELIMKNEMEKEFLKLQEAHEGQQALLQKMQSKVQKYKTIQDTCKKQEKVIVQLEQLLAKHGKGPQYNGENKDTYRTLSEQNIKLQAEVMQYKELLKTAEAKQKLPRSPPDKHVASNGPMSDMERLELYEKLEKAEGRIVALEKQLADNVRKWAKDKADLQVKLNESVVGQKTGFKNSYSSTSIDILDWHNGPKPPSPARPLGPRRPSPKLDPLERR
ncbi:coiled-coil domain-containing protein 33-like isoform X3 [Porites lutea]|uniref:coiled-coil domain-containing protein 33-like isoform X3 n=1 Tax=Porites lutea TaxID=51062 RepID=UPI003CC61AA2